MVCFGAIEKKRKQTMLLIYLIRRYSLSVVVKSLFLPIISFPAAENQSNFRIRFVVKWYLSTSYFVFVFVCFLKNRTLICLVFAFKEGEKHNRLYKSKDDDMRHRQELEKKRLPKIQRNELRNKMQGRRKQIRSERNKRESLSIGGLSAPEKEKMREVCRKSNYWISS